MFMARICKSIVKEFARVKAQINAQYEDFTRKVQSIKNGPFGPAAGGQAELPARTI